MNTEKIKELYKKEPKRSEIHKRIGMSSSTLFDIMNGNGNPTIDNIEKVAKYFGVPVGYFFDEEQKIITTEADNNSGLINIGGNNNVFNPNNISYLQQVIQEKDERIKEKDERILELKEVIQDLKEIIRELKGK